MKKIGIVTLHYPYNYGSALQAYSLQTYIESKGFEVSIVNYLMPYDYENYKLFRIKQYKERPKTVFSDIIYLMKNIKRRKAFIRFQNQYLNITENSYTGIEQMKDLDNVFDAFVCGSDQIWNFDCTNGVDDVYFLRFTNKKKIAYAPSMAQKAFLGFDENALCRYLNEFDALSVREEDSLNLLKEFTSKTISVVLDPTFLIETYVFDELADRSKIKLPGSKYVFVYLLEENLDMVEFVKKYAKDKKLEIVYISNISKKCSRMLQPNIDFYGISPDGFLKAIKNAEFVITNSFHATIFSVFFEKQFYVFKTKKSFVRLESILKQLDLENRIYYSGASDEKIDYDACKKRLINLKKKSTNYLDNALNLIDG